MKAYIAKDKISLEAFEEPPTLVECDTDYHKEWHGKCYWFPDELKHQLETEFAEIKQDKEIIEVDITLAFTYERKNCPK